MPHVGWAPRNAPPQHQAPASEARRGEGGTRRSKRRRRDAKYAAIALARRAGKYSDQAPRSAGADGLRALRRMRARQPSAPTQRLITLSADRMCWAGNAAAARRPRLARSGAWRWTRTRRQSSDCRAGRGRSQAALLAWRVRLRRHFTRTDTQHTHATYTHDTRTTTRALTGGADYARAALPCHFSGYYISRDSPRCRRRWSP